MAGAHRNATFPKNGNLENHDHNKRRTTDAISTTTENEICAHREPRRDLIERDGVTRQAISVGGLRRLGALPQQLAVLQVLQLLLVGVPLHEIERVVPLAEDSRQRLAPTVGHHAAHLQDKNVMLVARAVDAYSVQALNLRWTVTLPSAE